MAVGVWVRVRVRVGVVYLIQQMHGSGRVEVAAGRARPTDVQHLRAAQHDVTEAIVVLGRVDDHACIPV